jgi:hypothetical protein
VSVDRHCLRPRGSEGIAHGSGDCCDAQRSQLWRSWAPRSWRVTGGAKLARRDRRLTSDRRGGGQCGGNAPPLDRGGFQR